MDAVSVKTVNRSLLHFRPFRILQGTSSSCKPTCEKKKFREELIAYTDKQRTQGKAVGWTAEGSQFESREG
jgi:hypothetical protein